MKEKILAHHALSRPDDRDVQAGVLLRVSVDWVIASELSWMGMKNSIPTMKTKLKAWRNDRFWLSGDHTVDPRTYHEKKTQRLLEGLNSAKRDLQMTEHQGANVGPLLSCIERQNLTIPTRSTQSCTRSSHAKEQSQVCS